MSTVGRNELCPCGSGKKYKKCCLEKDRRAQNQVQCSLCAREFDKREYNTFQSIKIEGKRLYFCPECNINLSCSSCKKKLGDCRFDLYSCPSCGKVYVICEDCGRKGITSHHEEGLC